MIAPRPTRDPQPIEAKQYIKSTGFQKSRMFIPTDGIEMWVTAGQKGDEWTNDRNDVMAQCTTAEVERTQSHGGDHQLQPFIDTDRYTYVAIWFHTIFIKPQHGQWVKTSLDHHVTLAYLPNTPWAERWHMRNVCQDCVRNWVIGMVEPLRRPHDLLTFRYCHLLNDRARDAYTDRKGNYTSVPIYEETAETINRRLDNGTIAMAKAVFRQDPEKPGAVIEERVDKSIVHYWKRDCKRFQEATDMETGAGRIRQGSGTERTLVHVQLKDGRIVKDSEIGTLLHYLQQLLIYRFGAYHMKPRTDIALLGCDSWHITPHADTQYPTLVQVQYVTDPALLARLNQRQS